MKVETKLKANQLVGKINNTFFLPPIQRGFVWPIDRIESLFDSLYHDYPIGIPIIWKIKKWERKICPLFEFHESAEGDEDHLDEAKTPEKGKSYFVVLDGQQRLTSLFLGLKGFYKVKRKGKGLKNIEDNFEKQFLCFNLAGDEKIKKSDDDEQKVPLFKYKTEEECARWQKNNFWIPMREFCDNKSDISNYVKELRNRIPSNIFTSSKKINFKEKLQCLYKALYITPVHYFEVSLDGLKEDVSEIFARVNSKGTPLTKADLLFSRIIAEWPEGKDFVNELTKLLKKNLSLTKPQDFIMRAMLYINEYPVHYDLDAFNTNRIREISKSENVIRLKNAVNSLMNEKNKYGYTAGISENALLPILYFIARRQDDNKKIKDEWKEIKKYYIISQTFGLFSGSSDTTLAQMRKVIKTCVENKNVFSVDYLKRQKTNDEIKKFFKVEDDDLNEFLQKSIYKRNRGLAHLLLSAITKNTHGAEVVNGQMDHIHPESTIKNEEWSDLKDSLCNLELLSSDYNQSKNAKPLDEFMANTEYFPKTKKGQSERKDFLKDNFIPNEKYWKLENFDKFCEARRQILLKKLKPWFK